MIKTSHRFVRKNFSAEAKSENVPITSFGKEAFETIGCKPLRINALDDIPTIDMVRILICPPVIMTLLICRLFSEHDF